MEVSAIDRVTVDPVGNVVTDSFVVAAVTVAVEVTKLVSRDDSVDLPLTRVSVSWVRTA